MRHDLLGLDLGQDDRFLRGRIDLVDQPIAAGADEKHAVLLDHGEHQHRLAEDLGDESVLVDLVNRVAPFARLPGFAAGGTRRAAAATRGVTLGPVVALPPGF